MRVLMFGWEFPPHIAGGLGTACYGLTKGLAHHDVEVLFVMPTASGDEDQSAVRIINASDVVVYDTCKNIDEFLGKVDFLRVGSNLRPYIDPVSFTELVTEEQKYQTEEFKGYFKEKYKFSGKYGANLMEEVARYAMVAGAIAQQHEFDVIHAHDWLTNLAGIAAKKVSGKPLVIHVHATEFDRTGENVNPEVFRLEQTGMREADKVITVSNLTRNIVINKYGIDPSKVITVHNAVDFSGRSDIEVQRGVEEKIVTFLGRITFQKGPEYFIEAANKVLKMYPNVRFVMAGSGDLMNRSIKRVAQLGISDRFHLTGFLRGQDVQRMFEYSDVYVMPSVSEPFGISPLEAMISNVPTIISKQSGVAEVLKYAIKVDFWDIDALADSIYGLLNYPALSKMAIESGLEEVNSLKWDHAAAKVKRVYEAAINEKK
ncbi:MAG TPA: glycosyltransferase family 4 protein [Bacteroidales bacterium]|jgi:glycosyltransferase involved in cell wall biosynthesis|nr:glycosyltransferase family 4 protein [Bacteroidales bacterium]HPB89347.1 glycosyltransferase family 4 protein [Bacteroidales bacterium]HPY21654.1 glycosyltransferase family 4 protein [Bacteroidales bacterium]HQA93219.1 glycosyltransferase family 4 protein [Bacteroidales bacterium]HQN23500.1 glycosyltransferase family 4 protein [Bacteroidales bacterium]